MDKRLSSHKATMEIVKKHDFKFTKSLGQNFLIPYLILIMLLL